MEQRTWKGSTRGSRLPKDTLKTVIIVMPIAVNSRAALFARGAANVAGQRAGKEREREIERERESEWDRERPGEGRVREGRGKGGRVRASQTGRGEVSFRGRGGRYGRLGTEARAKQTYMRAPVVKPRRR
jgi:hypothetical protein